MSPRGWIFDFDGTLVDSLHGIVMATNAVVDDLGLAPLDDEVIKMMIGEGAGTLVKRALLAAGHPNPTIEHARLWVRHYHRFDLEGTQLFEGARALLEEAPVPLGLCTNKPIDPTLRILDHLRLRDRFVSVLGGDSLSVRKPHPRHLLAVAEEMDLTPDQVVYVGDSPADVGAAKAAGVRIAVISHGYSRVPHEELGGDWLVHDIAELRALLLSL